MLLVIQNSSFKITYHHILFHYKLNDTFVTLWRKSITLHKIKSIIFAFLNQYVRNMIFFIKKEIRIHFTWILGVLILFISSCQIDSKNYLPEYFYPMQKWEEGMVYEYHPVNNEQLPVEYWYFRKMKNDGKTILTGQYYDNTYSPRQIFNAEVTNEGVFIRDYILYEYDSLGNVNQNSAEILANVNFPFQINDTAQIFQTKLKWKMPTEEYPNGHLELSRDRKFKGDAAYSFKNKSYDCVEFQTDELMSDFNDGHLEKKYQGKELYAKKLGLIYYKKEIDENFVLEYELRDTFSMAKFEEKFKQYISE